MNCKTFSPNLLNHYRFERILQHSTTDELKSEERKNIPSAVSVWAEASDAGPEEHPGEGDAADEALCPTGDTPLLLHGRPHEGQQHDLHGLRDPAGAQEPEQERLEPAEAEPRQRLVCRVGLGAVRISRHAGPGKGGAPAPPRAREEPRERESTAPGGLSRACLIMTNCKQQLWSDSLFIRWVIFQWLKKSE